MISRKPVKGLLGAAHLAAKGIDISNIKEPMKVFSGSAAEAAIGFPENLNVAAALGLAGIGPERTMIEVWADPQLTRNTHRIEVDADSATFSMATFVALPRRCALMAVTRIRGGRHRGSVRTLMPCSKSWATRPTPSRRCASRRR